MQRIEGLDSLKEPFTNAVVTLGNFDGVHLGHKFILQDTIHRARSRGGTSVVFTFFPHPVTLLAPESCPLLIQTIDQRLDALEHIGVDACVVEPFTLNLAHIEPKKFISDILLEKLGAAEIVVGYDFTFGVHRRGSAEVLKHLGKERGVDVHIVEAQFQDELLISSTEIRHAVTEGNMKRARLLMDEPFTIRGTVVPGHGIGKTLGAHTANLVVENELAPGEGVYITRTKFVGDERAVPSVTSVGTNPTFKGRPFAVETHLIDFEDDLVNAHLEVCFFERMRGQVAFDSPKTLKGQIAQDIAAARRWHEKNKI